MHSRNPAGAGHRLLLPLLAAAQLVLAVDYSIVNTALPSIGTALGFSTDGLQWVISAYALTFGGLLLLGGRTADLLGRRRMFLLALALFGGASMVGGLSQSPAMLVAARAGQGVGGALLFPATLSLITTLFPAGPARNRALGLWGAAGASGLALGVLAGSVLTGTLGWRAVFYVNVPIVLTLLVGGWVLLPRLPRPAFGHYDLPGALLATGGMAFTVLALAQAPTVGWTAPTVLGSGLLGGLLLAAFVVQERRAPAPLLPLTLLRAPGLRLGALAGVVFGAAFAVQFFFLTLYLQRGLGESPLAAGLSFLPLAVAIGIGARVAGRLAGRVGVMATLASGLLIGSIGLGLYVPLAIAGAGAWLLPAEAIAGLGQGLTFTGIFIAAGRDAPARAQGVASATASTAQQIGAAAGLALLVGLLNWRAAALGGSAAGLTARQPHVLAAALPTVFLAQAGLALVTALALWATLARSGLRARRTRAADARDQAAACA